MKRLAIGLIMVLGGMAFGQSDVQIMWDTPTNNVDGSACTNLIAYRVYGGTESGVYTTNWLVSATNQTTIIPITQLPRYVAVAAINDWNLESGKSVELFLAPFVPAAPTNVRRVVFRLVGGQIVVTAE